MTSAMPHRATGIAAPLRAFVLAFIALVALAFPGRADDAALPDAATLQAIISGQIAAFQHDDAATAYGYASPDIQGVFTTPETFMAMVKNSYGAIYRPRSVAFGTLEMSDQGPVQNVYVTGMDGEAFIARYTFVKLPDGSWKINSVLIEKDDSPTI
jgi:hypothetical protein